MAFTDPKGAIGGGRWMAYRNDSGETVPPYGVVQLDGTEVESGLFFWTIKKPDGDADVANVALNGPTAVDSGQYGACTYDAPCWGAFDPGSLAVGDELGPQNGSFSLKKGNSGFITLGGVDTEKGRALIGKTGGGGSDGVAFEIDSATEEEDAIVATCTILARDDPETTSPGEDEYGKIEVIDMLGCFFDEEVEELEGRKGFARYMKIEGEDDPKWVVHSLCCPPEE